MDELDRLTLMMRQGVTERRPHLHIWNGLVTQHLSSAAEFHHTGSDRERDLQVAAFLRTTAMEEFDKVKTLLDC